MCAQSLVETFSGLLNFKNPIPLMIDRMGIRKTAYHVATRSGLRLHLRPGMVGDRYSCFETFGIGVYDIALARLRPGDTVIDIGANIGCFALAAWQAVGARGRVLALEPVSRTFERLTANVAMNDATSVEPLRLALADHIGDLKLFTPPEQYLFASKFNSIDGRNFSGEMQQVPCTTITALLERHHIERVALLKLDCEGSEHEIVHSMNAEAAAKIDHIVMELHNVPGWQNDATISHLKSLGYEHGDGYTHMFSRRTSQLQ